MGGEAGTGPCMSISSWPLSQTPEGRKYWEESFVFKSYFLTNFFAALWHGHTYISLNLDYICPPLYNSLAILPPLAGPFPLLNSPLWCLMDKVKYISKSRLAFERKGCCVLVFLHPLHLLFLTAFISFCTPPLVPLLHSCHMYYI